MSADRRILRVFPQRTAYTPDDDMVRIGQPGLFDDDLPGKVDEVHVSCVFTWDVTVCKHLAKIWSQFLGVKARMGGPGYSMWEAHPATFTPGLYVRKGVTFTSRGCYNHCPFCLVPKREGRLVELPVQPGHIVQDNNLLACSMEHFREVCSMLAGQDERVEFRGGFEAALLKPEHVAMLADVSVLRIYLASDGMEVTRALHKAREMLHRYSRERLAVYVLAGFYENDAPYRVEERCRELWRMELMPFVQLYRPPDGETYWGPEWKQLARRWSKPQIIRRRMKDLVHA